MKRLLLILAFLSIVVSLSFPAEHNILSHRFSRAQLQKILIPRKEWKPFPQSEERAAWEKVSPAIRQSCIAAGEKYLNYQWPALPASVALSFVRTGNRTDFESVYFERRSALCSLVLAELFEDKGRFTDQIVNGIWAICEETSWELPAHYPGGKEFLGLPDAENPEVDLFAASTAGMLAWIDYFCGEKLDSVSPQIRKRIFHEVDWRLLTPALAKAYAWQRRPMNWNTWICSNWLASALLLEKNEERRMNAIEKILVSLDNFLNPYPADGGCDEGPGYWTAAGMSLLESIELLNIATHNQFTVSNDSLIRNIGAFIYRAQISRGYFINFSDASPTMKIAGSMVRLFGARMSDTLMMQFGAAFAQDDRLDAENAHFTRVWLQLFDNAGVGDVPARLPLLRDVWLPDSKIMIARDHAGTDSGFCVAAIAAHNGKAHNHNDVGSFMVYRDNTPVLIDVGSGTYTARTFNKGRYDIWFNTSSFHSVPEVNGRSQHEGAEYKATEVVWKSDEGQATLQADIAHAYPREAGIQRWQRTIRLKRGEGVTIADDFTLSGKGDVVEHLMTVCEPDVSTPGEIRLDAKGQHIVLAYDPALLQASCEKKELTGPEDRLVAERWGDNVYRITLHAKELMEGGKVVLRITTR